jgi:hypothetical protein
MWGPGIIHTGPVSRDAVMHGYRDDDTGGSRPLSAGLREEKETALSVGDW